MKKVYRGLLMLMMLSFVFLLGACGAKSISESNVLDIIKEKDKMIWGVKYDTKLFGLMNIEKREVEGFDIDIAKEITKRLLGDEKKAEFVEVTSKTRIPLLKNGNIDAIIATMTISDERKKQVDFSDVYFDAGQSLLVKKGSDIKSIDDLKAGKIILAVKGSTSAVNVREKAPDVTVLELENYAEAFTALQSGQGDAMTTDNSILLGMASENPDYELVGGNFTEEPYGIAFNKGQTDLVNEVNRLLSDMKKDGTYDKIYKKWIKD